MNLFQIFGEGAEAKVIHNVSAHTDKGKDFAHPNRRKFRGLLTFVDQESDKSPSGARGHRVLLTRRAAENAIPSLLGMALDYTPALDRHDVKRKVGIVTQAEVVEKRLEFSGFIYERDFPEIVKELRDGRTSKLGLSYEIADALVEDIKASVWVLDRVTFVGAAILRKDKAAYSNTWIELL